MRHNTAKLATSTVILGLLVTGLSMPVSAKTTVLSPQSNWAVDFGEKRCRLVRTFGESDDRHVAIFDQFGPSDRFVLTLAGSSFKRFRGRTATSTHFSAGQEPFESQPYAGDLGSMGKAVIFRGLSLTAPLAEEDEQPVLPHGSSTQTLRQLNLDAAKTTQFIHLRQRGREVRLETGELGNAFAVLNQCTQDLVESWGLDAAAHLTAQRLPRWVNEEQVARRIADRYPSRALNRGESAFVNLRVNVSETGSVTHCFAENVTNAEVLESPACQEMENAVFEPALDAEGAPMKSFYQTRVTYRMNS